MANHSISSQTYHESVNWNDTRVTAALRKMWWWAGDLMHAVRYSRRKAAHGISQSLAWQTYHKALRTARRWKRSAGLFWFTTLALALAMIGTTFAGIYNMETTQVAGSMAYLPAIAVMFYLYRYAVGHSKPSRHRRGSVRPVW